MEVVEVANTIRREFGLELGQLVEVASLGLRFVVGSDSAPRLIVSWAHATERTDPRPHLREGELVCTVGSTLLEPASCTRLVEAVHEAGSAGICLGIGEVHTQIPRALIKECQRLDVPLIEMAHGVPFLAVNDVLAEARIQAQAGTSHRNAELVSTLLSALRKNSSIENMLSMAKRALGGALTFELADEIKEHHAEITLDSLLDGADTRADITTSEGNILAWRGKYPAPDADLLRQISRIFEIAKHEKVDHEAQNRQRIGQLFVLVGQGLADSAALMSELQLAGLTGKPLTISAWPAETGPLLTLRLPEALVADAPEATFAVTHGSMPVYQAASDLGLVCGHGSPVEVSQIARGIGEARATLGLARRNGRVAGPETLTTLSGLLEQQSQVRLVPFIDQLIRPLIDYDNRRGSHLLATLRTFVEQQGALQSTAELQYLHVNTVRHRLARIASILDRNPLDEADRVSLSIALWAYDRSRRYGA